MSARLSPRVEAYLADVARACTATGAVSSVVLFGSAATGGFTDAISDVDLLLVLQDGAGAEDRRRTRDMIAEIETHHGFGRPPSHRSGTLEAFADRLTGSVRAFFVCTRAGLLSGDPGEVLDVSPLQALFVDRITIASIVASGMTIWGEDLLPRVPLPPIRRLDVGMALFALFSQAWLSAQLYPVLPSATKRAMDALKRSVHSCYFCYHGRPAPLPAEVEFMMQRHGHMRALVRLMALRSSPQRSFRFVVSCLPALVLLHLNTMRHLRFPRDVRGAATHGPQP